MSSRKFHAIALRTSRIDENGNETPWMAFCRIRRTPITLKRINLLRSWILPLCDNNILHSIQRTACQVYLPLHVRHFSRNTHSMLGEPDRILCTSDGVDNDTKQEEAKHEYAKPFCKECHATTSFPIRNRQTVPDLIN